MRPMFFVLCFSVLTFPQEGITQASTKSTVINTPTASVWAQQTRLLFDEPMVSEGMGQVVVQRSTDRKVDSELQQRVLADLAPVSSWEDVRFSALVELNAYNSVWRGNVLDRDRLLVITSRAKYLNPMQWDRWERVLRTSTGGHVGPDLVTNVMSNIIKTMVLSKSGGGSPDPRKSERFWVVVNVLATDLLFSTDGYREDLANRLVGRLERLPPDAVATLVKALAITGGQAAMTIATAEFAFNGTDFLPAAYADAFASLQKLLPPKK